MSLARRTGRSADDDMLIGVYRGKIKSIPCESLGDEYRWSREQGKAIHVGKVSEFGQSWLNLVKGGLIVDYDSFGGFHYCQITTAGEDAAERLIAQGTEAQRAETVKHGSVHDGRVTK